MDTKRLKFHVNRFREFQDESGRVIGDLQQANRELKAIEKHLELMSKDPNLGDLSCVLEDFKKWIECGLDTPPDFSNTAELFIDVDNLPQKLLYAGPMMMANAGKQRGLFFEFFYADIDIPNDLIKMRKEFLHPEDRTVPIRLIDATDSLRLGNNVVLFPENIALSAKKNTQNFAVFMFDKFQRIYQDTTLPLVKKVLESDNALGDKEVISSERLSEDQTYVARCLWGYFHDYYHYQGCRPISTQLHIKMKWVTGLLEELKVDCQTALLMVKDTSLPYRRDILEFILFERLFRYPQEEDAEVNFDSGTGVFLYNWLARRDVFIKGHARWEIQFQQLVESLEEFVSAVEALEREDNDTYLRGAQDMVFRYLEKAPSNKKFLINDEYKNFLNLTEAY